MALDTAPARCQTHPSNWLDHWASLSRGTGAGMDEKGMGDGMGDTVTFTVSGSPQVVSRAIEEYARTQGSVSAIVVPWESDEVTLSMAVTAVKTDGWAIEHTNLGTIRLKAAGEERTSVAIAAEPPDHPDQQKLTAVFEKFAQQVEGRLQAVER